MGGLAVEKEQNIALDVAIGSKWNQSMSNRRELVKRDLLCCLLLLLLRETDGQGDSKLSWASR